MLKVHMLMVFFLIAPLVSCGGPHPSPEEVIARAIDAINEVQTYRFEMTGTMTQDGETNYVNMQGEFASPDRSHAIATFDGDTQEDIRIGQTEYHLASDSDSWEVREWPPTMTSARNNWALNGVETFNSLVELVELQDEKNDGVSCFHYRGNIDVEAQVEEQIANLDPTLPGYEEMVKSIEQLLQWEHSVEFWIGKEDYLLRQTEAYQDMTYTENAGEDTESEERITANYTYRFFDFDQPITIEPP